jgi:RNA polymerase sigma-70 factor (ECF subfamily)
MLTKQEKYTEQELTSSLQRREQSAFSYLYDQYSGALYSVIHNIVTDSEIANDVLQEVFVKIWKQIESYDASKGRLFTWMLNISRNASIDMLRSISTPNKTKSLRITYMRKQEPFLTLPIISV